LERGFFGFYLSQPFEISQNRERNLWKSLEKTARNLEMSGKKLGGWRWRAETNYPVQSGLTPTAGGVVFFGGIGEIFTLWTRPMAMSCRVRKSAVR
jgi:hypothetical protein